MKNLKNQKGITLVALVVTIIVLLILAGVSLSLVAGSDGILSKAGKAVKKNADAAAKEEAELLIETTIADYYEARYVNGTMDADMEQMIETAVTAEKAIPSGTMTVADGTITLTVTKTGNTFTASFDDNNRFSGWTAGENNK